MARWLRAEVVVVALEDRRIWAAGGRASCRTRGVQVMRI
jgi:hypothetical protein